MIDKEALLTDKDFTGMLPKEIWRLICNQLKSIDDLRSLRLTSIYFYKISSLLWASTIFNSTKGSNETLIFNQLDQQCSWIAYAYSIVIEAVDLNHPYIRHSFDKLPHNYRKERQITIDITKSKRYLFSTTNLDFYKEWSLKTDQHIEYFLKLSSIELQEFLTIDSLQEFKKEKIKGLNLHLNSLNNFENMVPALKQYRINELHLYKTRYSKESFTALLDLIQSQTKLSIISTNGFLRNDEDGVRFINSLGSNVQTIELNEEKKITDKTAQVLIDHLKERKSIGKLILNKAFNFSKNTRYVSSFLKSLSQECNIEHFGYYDLQFYSNFYCNADNDNFFISFKGNTIEILNSSYLDIKQIVSNQSITKIIFHPTTHCLTDISKDILAKIIKKNQTLTNLHIVMAQAHRIDTNIIKQFAKDLAAQPIRANLCITCNHVDFPRHYQIAKRDKKKAISNNSMLSIQNKMAQTSLL